MLGKLEIFDLINGNWSEYIEILQQFIIVNDFSDAAHAVKQRAILLSSVGGKTYSLIRDLCATTLPSDKTFVELKELVAKHLNPQPLVIAERFKFHKRDQLESESIAQFVASLNKLTEFCKFESFRSEALRDRFVCGLKSVNIQKELLSKADLTFTTAVETALALEAAECNAVELQGSTNGEADVNKLKQSRAGKSNYKTDVSFHNAAKIVCYCCGKDNHKSNVCKFNKEICRTCNRSGHLSRMCGKIPDRKFKPRNGAKANSKKFAKHLKVQSDSDTDFDDDYNPAINTVSVGSLTDSESFSGKPWFVKFKVKNRNLKLEYDSGTEATIIPSKWYNDYFSDKKLLPTKVKLATWSNEKIKPRGVVILNVTHKGVSQQLRAIVARDNF